VLALLRDVSETRFPLRACRLYAELAYVFMKLYRYDDGYQANSKALSLYELAGTDDANTLRRIVQNMGWLLWRLNAFDAGLHSFRQALGLAQELNRQHDVTDIKHGMAMCWWGKGNLEEALRLIEEVIPSLEGMFLQLAHTNAGVILCDLGRKKEALASFQKALDTWHPSYSPYSERYMALNEKGRVLFELGRPAEALSALDEAWTLVRNSGSAQEQVRNLMYRADIALEVGQHEESLSLLRQAESVDFSHPRLTPLIHIKIAQSEIAMGDSLGEAKEALEVAVQHLVGRGDAW